MELLILRHGKAADHAASDRERPLTDRGLAQVRRQARDNAKRLENLDGIASSPLLRARQTAGEVIKSIGYRGQLTVSDLLAPDADVAGLEKLLEASGADKLLLVSHQPFVGRLLAWLTDKPELASTMGTASIACIELTVFARGCGTLKWQEHPSL